MMSDDVQEQSPDSPVRTSDVIGSFSLAADLAMGLPAEHALRSCYIGMCVAEELRLPATQRLDLYYTELLIDAGCTAWASQVATVIGDDETQARQDLIFHRNLRSHRDRVGWLLRYVAPKEWVVGRAVRAVDVALKHRASLTEGFRNAFEVAQRLAGRLGMPRGVQDALRGLSLEWDPTDPAGRVDEEAALLSRIAYMTIVLEVAHRAGGEDEVARVAKERAGDNFDPQLVDAFNSASNASGFWDPLAGASIWDIVQELEPPSPHRYMPQYRLPGVAESFADFVDLKAPHLAGHSRRVAETARRVSRRMLLSPAQIAMVGIAAATHDIGFVAVPAFTLMKPESGLGPGEWETMRLHPYHGQRILSRVPAFSEAATLVGAHHEREDGRGYYRGIPGPQIPIGAHVIAVSDRFDELTHDAPGRHAVEPGEALEIMSREGNGGVWLKCVDALAASLDPSSFQGRRGARSEWPAGLTDREVEVLRVLSKGLHTKQMADILFVSEATLRHHLEHIYDKAGVSTRTGAVLFAMEQGLIS